MERLSEKGGRNAAFFFFLLLVAVIDTGKLFPVRLGILRLAVFSAAVLLLWRGRDEESELELYPLIVGGFVLLSLGHAFSSIYPWVSMQHALNIAMAAVILGWACRVVRNDPDRAKEWVFLPICAVAVVQFVMALYQRFAAGNFRPRGTFDNTNFFAEFMAIAGVLCLSRFLAKGERSPIRMMCATGAVLFLGPHSHSPRPGQCSSRWFRRWGYSSCGGSGGEGEGSSFWQEGFPLLRFSDLRPQRALHPQIRIIMRGSSCGNPPSGSFNRTRSASAWEGTSITGSRPSLPSRGRS